MGSAAVPSPGGGRPPAARAPRVPSPPGGPRVALLIPDLPAAPRCVLPTCMRSLPALPTPTPPPLRAAPAPPHLGAPRPRTLGSRRAEPALGPAQLCHFLVGGGRGLPAQPRGDRAGPGRAASGWRALVPPTPGAGAELTRGALKASAPRALAGGETEARQGGHRPGGNPSPAGRTAPIPASGRGERR